MKYVMTADRLREHDACANEVEAFETLYPDGLEVTLYNLREAAGGGFNVWWLYEMLPAKQCALCALASVGRMIGDTDGDLVELGAAVALAEEVRQGNYSAATAQEAMGHKVQLHAYCAMKVAVIESRSSSRKLNTAHHQLYDMAVAFEECTQCTE